MCALNLNKDVDAGVFYEFSVHTRTSPSSVYCFMYITAYIMYISHLGLYCLIIYVHPCISATEHNLQRFLENLLSSIERCSYKE